MLAFRKVSKADFRIGLPCTVSVTAVGALEIVVPSYTVFFFLQLKIKFNYGV
jgi:hypothetical protein